MFTHSKHFLDFHIAGLRFSDATEVIRDLSVGDKLELRCEEKNPFDPEAVALYFGDCRIGYIPRHSNASVFKLLYFGHEVFEARVIQINTELDPAEQIRVVVSVIDRRACDR